MRLLSSKNPVPFAPSEQFFLELWHSMTHERSLDSHQVRRLNARTIVRELDQELRIGRISQDDLLALCAEADETLVRAPLVAQQYPRHLVLIQPFLKDPPEIPKAGDKKPDPKAEQKFREFKFVAADFAAALERDYLASLLEGLPLAIQAGDEAQIFALTGALISDLVERGWPIETLFSWVSYFTSKGPPAFASSLDFMLVQLAKGPQSYKVILRLNGSSTLSGLGTLSAFRFSGEAGFEPTTGAQTKFAEPHSTTAFAEIKVDAVDFVSAGIAAREAFEDCLDPLRYNFEPTPLKVEERCVVRRLLDEQLELTTVRNLVPNPVLQVPEHEFRRFVENLDKLTRAKDIESESQERLRTALRHYRFGRDAESYKDKFLNWWMGIESLAHVIEGEKIGATAVRHASDCLLQRYLFRSLGDFLHTLKENKIPWHPDMATETGRPALGSVTLHDALKLLQSGAAMNAVRTAFTTQNHPIANFYFNQLSQTLRDVVRTADALKSHHQRLTWHLSRLYRIRCCIVHGSPIRFRLPLLTANLEFYLREMILVCLRSLTQNTHLSSLREVFQRATVTRLRTDAELRANGAGVEAIRRAVFASPIIQEV